MAKQTVGEARKAAADEQYNVVDGAKDALNSLSEELREKYDNMPEGLQQGEVGQKLYEAAEALDRVTSQLDDAIQELESIEF